MRFARRLRCLMRASRTINDVSRELSMSARRFFKQQCVIQPVIKKKKNFFSLIKLITTILIFYFQGRELVPDNRIQIHSSDGLSRLTLAQITADDAGKYAVSVENALGSDCRFASVAVEGNLMDQFLN